MVTQEERIQQLYCMDAKGKKAPQKPTKQLETDEYLKRLGARIKDLRIKAGYTSYEYFAYEHNISRAQFGRYENGQDIRFSSLVKVVNAFGITLEEFFREGFE